MVQLKKKKKVYLNTFGMLILKKRSYNTEIFCIHFQFCSWKKENILNLSNN